MQTKQQIKTLTHNGNISELVCSRNRIVVEQRGACDPARARVIGENDQLVFLSFVSKKVKALLNIANNYALPNGVNSHDVVRNVLQE